MFKEKTKRTRISVWKARSIRRDSFLITSSASVLFWELQLSWFLLPTNITLRILCLLIVHSFTPVRFVYICFHGICGLFTVGHFSPSTLRCVTFNLRMVVPLFLKERKNPKCCLLVTLYAVSISFASSHSLRINYAEFYAMVIVLRVNVNATAKRPKKVDTASLSVPLGFGLFIFEHLDMTWILEAWSEYLFLSWAREKRFLFFRAFSFVFLHSDFGRRLSLTGDVQKDTFQIRDLSTTCLPPRVCWLIAEWMCSGSEIGTQFSLQWDGFGLILCPRRCIFAISPTTCLVC